jgi:hypothetical protein
MLVEAVLTPSTDPQGADEHVDDGLWPAAESEPNRSFDPPSGSGLFDGAGNSGSGRVHH